METGKVMPLEDGESSTITRNSQITELLELCIQPENNKEMETIVSKFWKKYERFSGNENFCEFDICCMYAFDYAYKNNIECLAAVSRSVYAYLDQSGLVLKEGNRNRLISCGNGCFLTGLRKFKNFDSEEGMVILVQSMSSSLMCGNVGFALFLAKFGLIDFPCEANEKSRKLIVELLNWFNMSYEYTNESVPEDIERFIQVDELLNRMTQSKISFRRSMLIFCTICIVAEYGMYEKISMIGMIAPQELGLNTFASRMKTKSIPKMSCLDLYINTTTETKITFIDIEVFTATVLNPHLGTQFGRYLVETSTKIMSEAHAFYNPRSLKDFARCKIRACVPSSMMLTEHVKQFTIPDTLKEFILFHRENFWNLIIENQVNLNILQLLQSRISEIANVGEH